MQHPPAPPNSALITGGWKQAVFNAFLLSLTASGALGLLATPFKKGPVFRILHLLSGTAGLFQLLLAILIVLLVCSYRHLRWTLLIPLLFLTFWESFYLLPLPAYLPWKAVCVAASLAELALGLGTMAVLRRQSGGSALFPAESTRLCEFSWSRSFVSFFLKLFVLLPLLVAYVAFSAQIYIREHSAGFIEITREGVFTEARTYEKEGHNIYLLPTVHIASPAFYDSLMETLPEKQTVILPEGVTDQKGLLKAGLDYSAPADAVGLSVQPDLTKRSKEFAAMHCDADASEFSPGTLAVLDEVGKLLKLAQSSKDTGLFSFSDQFSPESLARMNSINLETLLNDILEKRNKRLVLGINKVLPTYQHIAIPWGAAHMPGIERALLQQKARKISSKRVAVFRWSELKWPIEL